MDPGDIAAVGTPIEGEYQHSVYANQLNCSHTPHDFRLIFSQIEIPLEPVATDQGVVVLRPRMQASITVPPTLMPAMIELLQGQLDAYRDNYGGGAAQ